MNKQPEYPCKFNQAVVCEGPECYHCGWDPEVAKERAEKIIPNLVDGDLYVIPFTGYCEVWAESPEEALKKADDGDMFFVHYDFDEEPEVRK